jgi:radical SAM protein with 4Fe4S-binding SPASM domain
LLELLERVGYVPRQGVWELTLVCNLRCQHCGSWAGARRDDELSPDECRQLADELAALGLKRLTLGGGEPTVHPLWDELGKRLTDHGVRVNMVTNGWTWSQAHLDKALAAGLVSIAFSLDGLREGHDTIRRPGSFDRVMAGLDMCRAAGMPTGVVSHINGLNYKHLREMRDLLAEHGVDHWQLQMGNPQGAMTEHLELVVPPEELLWLIPEIAALRSDAVARPRVFAGDNLGYYGIHEAALRECGGPIGFWVGCQAGCRVIGIESNGNIKGCLSLPSGRHGTDRFTEGNVRDVPLAQLWSRPGAFAHNRQFSEDQLGGFCAVCRYRDICRGGCSWTAYSHTKDRYDNPYCFYRQAVKHGRLELLGEDVPSEVELAFVHAD